MRIALVAVVACGGSAPQLTTPVVAPGDAAPPRPIVEEPAHLTVDPIAVLTPVEDQEVSWLSPGGIQLELGGAGIESPGGNRPIEVSIIDRHGGQVRAAVRLPHARFSLWSDGARLFGVITSHEQHVRTNDTQMPMDEMSVVLHTGARVKKLAHRGSQTQIRYLGALQVEGWVPDDALGTTSYAGEHGGPVPSGRRKLMVTPGTIIRSRGEWGMNELAVVANYAGGMLDIVKEDPSGWAEVTYGDGDVAVHGFTSRMQPPGRVHRLQDPDVPPPVITPNTKVASGTCLYAKPGGDPIGYIVGDRDVQLDDRGNGWWLLAVDTPWGPIPFAAKGPNKDALTACAPAGAVPPPATTP